MAETTQTVKTQETNITEVLLGLIATVQKQQEQINQLLQNGTQKKNGRGGRHAPQHVLDLKTGKVYRTKAEAGMAVAPEYGLKVHNFVWYELVKGTKNNPAKCPDRFRVISEEEYQERLKKQNSQQAKPNQAVQQGRNK